MGEHFTINKLKLKKRPKKRGKYKKKPHDPKKPSTQDEKDEKFAGYKEMKRLSKGIVEEYNCIKCKKPEDECKCDDALELMESFIPPSNWGKIMSGNKTTQLIFEQRLEKQRKKFGAGTLSDEDIGTAAADVFNKMQSPQAKLEQELSDRLQKIQDEDPSFIRRLTFLVSPVIDAAEEDGDTDASIDERRKKQTRAETSVSKMNPEQVKGMCRKRFGLMSLEALLNLIDRMNQATSGKLHQQNKQ